jgi:transcriptional regulator with XRE-family HTH domain
MKRTPDDDAFAAAFGHELKRHYEAATGKGSTERKLSDEEFAATLDVSRTALMKYLRGGATPSLRVVVLAFRNYGICVRYSGTPIFRERQHRKELAQSITQLVLPFSVHGPNAAGIEAKIEPKGQNRFEIHVELRRAG